MYVLRISGAWIWMTSCRTVPRVGRPTSTGEEVEKDFLDRSRVLDGPELFESGVRAMNDRQASEGSVRVWKSGS